MDISIIIPVFNAEKYLLRCLDSIFNQNFSGSFEVIAIEDGSSDRSLQVLKKYQEIEVRLKIIEHVVNKKQSVARANGMKVSLGDYIMHVDADDWLLPEALENLYRKCLETDVDVVVYNYIRENNEGKITLVKKIKKQLITNDKLKILHHFFHVSCNKIVKRVLIEDMITGQVSIGNAEDLLYGIEILLRAKKICLVPEYYYAYFINTESITWKVNLETLINNQKIIYNELQKILNANGCSSEFKRRLFAQRENVIYYLLLKNHLSGKNRVSTDDFVNHLPLYYSPADKRMSRLVKSAGNKYFCMMQYIISIGLLNSLLILIGKISKIGKNLFKFKKVLL
jgi:glycosyltransferase involved in cell wall biosynthesis